jgi:hypothetical protein
MATSAQVHHSDEGTSVSRKSTSRRQSHVSDDPSQDTRHSLPDADECWSRWVHIASDHGEIEVDPATGITIRDVEEPEIAAHIMVSKSELYGYVGRWVESRKHIGLDAGLEAGLPNPLIDGLAEGFGSHMEGSAKYGVRGWDLVRVESE